MPSIHPSESPPLGWLIPCLAVTDLKASLDWWAKLDLEMYGGNVEENWAMLRNRAVEIHLFQGHIEKDLLNFRGGDVAAIRAAFLERGLTSKGEESFAKWTFADPDGREVFLDASPEEVADYEAGKYTTIPFGGDDVHAGEGMDLGNFTVCLNCADLAATSKFYETVGLVPTMGEPENGWSILTRVDHPPKFGERMSTTSLSLFQGMIPADTLNFRGGNVAEIAATLADRGVDIGDGIQTAPDGGESLFILAPDDHPILFDTSPPERLY
jgi:catechol 2,3-dioxygenase-like lactoylglutathione lyase family enzyme